MPRARRWPGRLSADGDRWSATEPLGYGKSYTYTGAATDATGRTVPVTGSFSTIKPAELIGATLNIADRDTVGIAAPIILQFDGHVTDQAAVQRALQVQTSVPTVGSWAWLPDDNGGSRVHWRSKDYLQPGTQVTVTAKLYGVDYGEGRWGQEDLNLHFTVGWAQIVKADVTSHRLVVIRDGKVIMDLPASYGLGSDPNRVTRSGIHIVMSKSPLYLMSNPAYGYVKLPLTLVGADLQQRRVYSRQPGDPRGAGLGECDPRLSQSVHDQRQGILRQCDLR